METHNMRRGVVEPKTLSTGQTISLTAHEEKTLRHAYDYMAGYSKRLALTNMIDKKKQEYKQLVPPGSSTNSPTKKPMFSDAVAASPIKTFKVDLRTDTEVKMDEKHTLKDEITALEEKLKQFDHAEHVISLKDMDVFLRNIGNPTPKKVIQNMIWEIDEQGDEVIDYEEFQLTYFRNITIRHVKESDGVDRPEAEPNTFFHIMQFTIFDSSHKGHIVEDDCMEILYARYGSQQLERELNDLFGAKRASAQRGAAGGATASLNLQEYLNIVTAKTGERACVF